MIDGPYEEWNYLINGKQLDLKKYVVDGRLVVPEGVALELVATFKEDGVLYESEPVEIKNSSYPDLKFVKYEQKLEMKTAQLEAEREQEDAKLEVEFEVESLINEYLSIYSSGYVDALDTFISTSSAFYEQQKKYLQGLLEKDIRVEIGDYIIESLKETSSGSYTVTVDELYTIYKPNVSPNEVKQKSIYTVKLMNGDYYITSLKLE